MTWILTEISPRDCFFGCVTTRRSLIPPYLSLIPSFLHLFPLFCLLASRSITHGGSYGRWTNGSCSYCSSPEESHSSQPPYDDKRPRTRMVIRQSRLSRRGQCCDCSVRPSKRLFLAIETLTNLSRREDSQEYTKRRIRKAVGELSKWSTKLV